MLLDTTKTNPAVPMTDAEIYNAAADYMEVHGHCKGAYSKDGPVCPWGALSAVITGDAFAGGRVPYRLIERLERFTGGSPLIIWADRPERTQAEAVALLRQAARDSK